MDSAQSAASRNMCTNLACGNTSRKRGTHSSEWPERSTTTRPPNRSQKSPNIAS